MENLKNKESIRLKIVALIVGYGNCEESDINPHTKLNETGIDSLGVVELIFAIEDHYNISLEDTDDIASRLDFGTIDNVVDLVINEIEKQTSFTEKHLHSELV